MGVLSVIFQLNKVIFNLNPVISTDLNTILQQIFTDHKQ